MTITQPSDLLSDAASSSSSSFGAPPGAPSIGSPTISLPDALNWHWIISARLFPIKRIPKACRLLWSDVLFAALSYVMRSPQLEVAWLRLMALPKLCLRLPPRGGKKKTRAFAAAPHISRLLSMARDGEWGLLFAEADQASGKKTSASVKPSSAEMVRERVMDLVQDGQFAKAVKALDSNGLHALTPEICDILKSKHPQSPPLQSPSPSPAQPLVLSTEQVMKALSGFHRGTAPGASRFRAVHLQDALTIPTGDADGRLTKALTKVVNILASGEAPSSVSPWLAGAPLYPLKKRDGGVRPVAVGEVLRRLVSRACCLALHSKFEATFMGVGQLGVGIRAGAEAAVQAVRVALAEHPEFVVLKVDLENAFNTVDRDAILAEIRHLFPELERWFLFCYATPAHLFCNNSLLPFSSSCGVQQGDPLGPFLFALALRRCCHRLRNELAAPSLSVWYLDDGTLVGPLDQILKGWRIIQEEVPSSGLRVNASKCELFPSAAPVPTELFLGVKLLQTEGFELLGSPIGSDQFCEDYVKMRVLRIRQALTNLELVDDPQVELALLRSCVGFPKFAFSLRSAPSTQILPAAVLFDETIDDVIATRFALSMNEDQNTLFHLPVSHGGLGVVQGHRCHIRCLPWQCPFLPAHSRSPASKELPFPLVFSRCSGRSHQSQRPARRSCFTSRRSGFSSFFPSPEVCSRPTAPSKRFLQSGP